MLIDAGADHAYVPDTPEQFTTKVFSIDSLVQPLYFEWDFGDSGITSGTLAPGDLTDDGLGNVTFSVDHTYSGLDPTIATVTVLNAAGAPSIRRCRMRRHVRRRRR
jgi:hypothetical protein